MLLDAIALYQAVQINLTAQVEQQSETIRDLATQLDDRDAQIAALTVEGSVAPAATQDHRPT